MSSNGSELTAGSSLASMLKRDVSSLPLSKVRFLWRIQAVAFGPPCQLSLRDLDLCKHGRGRCTSTGSSNCRMEAPLISLVIYAFKLDPLPTSVFNLRQILTSGLDLAARASDGSLPLLLSPAWASSKQSTKACAA